MSKLEMLEIFSQKKKKRNARKYQLIHKDLCWGPFVEAQWKERPNDEGHKELTV